MEATVSSTLQSISEVRSAIAAGESLFLAGSREALSQLPRGSWAGGTTPYFMAPEGGLVAEDRIFVTRIPEFALEVKAADYGPETLADLYRDAPENGFTFLVLPASTGVLKRFAEKAPSFDGFLRRPVVGWVAGVRVDRIGKEQPMVFNGISGEAFDARCVALHVALPASKSVCLEIVNIFTRAGGDLIRFEEAGFRVNKCQINGVSACLASYIIDKKISRELPLIGDDNGRLLNVSIQNVDAKKGVVDFYAPVFAGVEYRFAQPVGDYSAAFARAVGGGEEPLFACNCILNYFYGKLEGRRTGNIIGPITFGEIAHQLLNQSMVRLYLRDIG
jgi:hypothetical protein